jgi:hypothetical protein
MLNRGASGGLERARAIHSRDAVQVDSGLILCSIFMMGKRTHTDSTGPFQARKYAADLLRGDVDSPGSFIEGRVFSMNPRKNVYTLDIRLDSKAKAAYLDIYIEDKLQKRLGELLVGDHLQISLRGAQLLPFTGASSHLPVILRFREGITALLVSRAGLQAEKEKLFQVWPGSSEHSFTLLRSAECDPHFSSA